MFDWKSVEAKTPKLTPEELFESAAESADELGFTLEKRENFMGYKEAFSIRRKKSTSDFVYPSLREVLAFLDGIEFLRMENTLI